MKINLMTLTALGLSEEFLNKFAYLVGELKDSNSNINADKCFNLDDKAIEWLCSKIK
jgi:hypothetical protein